MQAGGRLSYSRRMAMHIADRPPIARCPARRRPRRKGAASSRYFSGAAPGVGKTYEMLTQARQRRLDGVDVVIGVVETHGRVETDALTKGFETIPKKRSLYKGRVLAEMDLDAILQRQPQLVLVDELAHTNRRGQPPSQALSGCRGTARGRDRRLHDRQHPAHREPERRHRPDHAHPRARNRARRGPGRGRRDRAGRHDGGRSAAASARRQGLREGAGRARAEAFLLARQSDGLARARAAQDRPARRPRHDRTTCRRMPSAVPGRPANAFWSASTSIPPRAELVRRARRLADSFKAHMDRALCRRPAASGA